MERRILLLLKRQSPALDAHRETKSETGLAAIAWAFN